MDASLASLKQQYRESKSRVESAEEEKSEAEERLEEAKEHLEEIEEELRAVEESADLESLSPIAAHIVRFVGLGLMELSADAILAKNLATSRDGAEYLLAEAAQAINRREQIAA